MPETGHLFVSYARADNDPTLGGTSDGWVTMLRSKLSSDVGKRMPHNEVKVVMDVDQPPHAVVLERLEQGMQASHCLLVVMSPSYLKSDWCTGECDMFVKAVGKGSPNGRVFIIEMLPTDRNDWPKSIAGLSSIKFYRQVSPEVAMTMGWPTAKADEGDFWSTLIRLSQSIADQMEVHMSATGSSEGGKAVWIGSSASNMDGQWNSLADAIKQRRYKVMPPSPDAYDHLPEPQRIQRLRADLRVADVIVQLYGSLSDGALGEAESRAAYLLRQEIALARHDRGGVPHILWRHSDLSLDRVIDPRYRDLLTGSISSGFETLRSSVLDAVKSADQVPQTVSSVETPSSQDSGKLPTLSVCINADEDDRSLATMLADLIEDAGAEVSIVPRPSEAQTVSKFNEDYEKMLSASDGLIVVYGSAPGSWVLAELSNARKILSRHRKGIWGALLDGPPPEKAYIEHRFRQVIDLDCRGGVQPDHVHTFLSRLGSPVGTI